MKELDRLRVIEEAKKTAGQFYGKEVMGYSSFDKSTLPLLTGHYQEKTRKILFGFSIGSASPFTSLFPYQQKYI